MDIDDARERLNNLYYNLGSIISKDQEQEIQGIAIPVIEAVIEEAKKLVPHDPVVKVIDEWLTPALMGGQGSIRAVDAFLVVGQLLKALPKQRLAEMPEEDWLDL
jgi:hypothetical protein